ncbi:MAG: flagellar export chaperone FliS [Gammaproteobacteria bacterium]|nr:MAG: flagellar export chaperone FliS [Gammaproteobacteria bacterium]
MVSTSIKKYRNANAESVVDANPHQLISIILKHILSNIAIAHGAISRQEVENKGKALTKAIALVGELQDSLDMEQGGEISANLFELYDYIVRTLVQANLKNDSSKLDEVRGLILTVKEGWDAIPADKRVKPTPSVTNQK